MKFSNNNKAFILSFILLIKCFLIIGCDYKEPPLDGTPDCYIKEQKVQEVPDKKPLSKGQDEQIVKEDITSKNDGKTLDETLYITLSIVGSDDTGVIMAPITVEIAEGDTVLDVLVKAAREENIPVSFRGKRSTAYIEGIDNLYEFDYGPESGWLYNVNGDFYSKSAGSFNVKSGDIIKWLYTTDMGKDIGANIVPSRGPGDA